MTDSNQSSIQKSSDFKEISREDLQKLLLYRREESDRKPEEDSMFFKFLREILGLTKDSEKEKKAVSSIDNFVEKYFPQTETKDLLEHRQEIKGKAINIGGKRIEIFDKDKNLIEKLKDLGVDDNKIKKSLYNKTTDINPFGNGSKNDLHVITLDNGEKFAFSLKQYAEEAFESNQRNKDNPQKPKIPLSREDELYGKYQWNMKDKGEKIPLTQESIDEIRKLKDSAKKHDEKIEKFVKDFGFQIKKSPEIDNDWEQKMMTSPAKGILKKTDKESEIQSSEEKKDRPSKGVRFKNDVKERIYDPSDRVDVNKKDGNIKLDGTKKPLGTWQARVSGNDGNSKGGRQ
jgi:hypothetical protein